MMYEFEPNYYVDESNTEESLTILEFEDQSVSLERELQTADFNWDRFAKIVVPPELARLELMDISPVLSSLHLIEVSQLWISNFPKGIRPSARRERSLWNSINMLDFTALHSLIFSGRVLTASHVITQDLPSADEDFNKTTVASPDNRDRQNLRFRPSLQLLSYWVNGTREYMKLRNAADVAHSEAELLSESDFKDYDMLQTAFSKRLKRMFSLIGYRQQHGLEQRDIISDGMRFTLRAQLALLDRFPIIPYDMGAFFAQLHDEISAFLRNGGRVGGNWGELCLDGQNIVISVLPAPTRTEGYETATMYE